MASESLACLDDSVVAVATFAASIFVAPGCASTVTFAGRATLATDSAGSATTNNQIRLYHV
jgi:hypothetical protein